MSEWTVSDKLPERKDGRMDRNLKDYLTGLQHIGLPTNDLDVTVDFYKVLGFQTVFETVNEKAGERVVFLRLGDLTIEIYENKQAVMTDGAWDHVALNVTDIEAVFQTVREKGVHMLDQEIQFLPFWEHGVKFFTVKGPNGEKVEFSQYL